MRDARKMDDDNEGVTDRKFYKQKHYFEKGNTFTLGKHLRG